MKKYFSYAVLVLLVLAGCSSDNSDFTKSDGTGGSLAIFVLKGNYLYTVDNQTMHVFSLINEQQPVKVNDVPIGFNIETLFSFDDKLYIGSQNGMYIYSIENPENPTYISEAQHFTACDPVVANATHAYVTLHSTSFCGNNLNVLQVYDTSNPSNPNLIHTRNLVQPKGLGLYGDYLIVCDEVIKIFLIINPENPLLVHSLPKECFDVIIKGNDLFAIGSEGMYRYELNADAITESEFKSQIIF
jgi:hypothetical protein